eukprot:973253-Rhodomonas_salina.1
MGMHVEHVGRTRMSVLGQLLAAYQIAIGIGEHRNLQYEQWYGSTRRSLRYLIDIDVLDVLPRTLPYRSCA